MVRRNALDPAWLHYTLLVLLLAGATSGGLVLLGCDETDFSDTVVADETQRDGEGGVLFPEGDPRTEARVRLNPTVDDALVKWSAPKGQPYLQIPDPKNSNEIVILRPPGNETSDVTVNGEYQKNGTTKFCRRFIRISR